MIIDCISDLHGCKPALQGGDLLIIAGDLTARDEYEQHFEFEDWLLLQNYKMKVVIAGNHDGFLVKNGKHMFAGAEYLEDSGFEYEYEEEIEEEHKFKGMISYKVKRKLKIWGSPWTPEFYDWHFMKKRGPELKEVWDKIPLDTDILITHGPPYGVLDKVDISSRGDEFKHAGCEELRLALERVKPRLHVFGHIHEEGGKQLLFKHQGFNTICVNASIMDEDYNPIHQPIRIILEEKQVYQAAESEKD